MVVGFMTTYAVSAYYHKRCEFESRLGEVYKIQHNVINFVSDLRQFGGFLLVLRFPPAIKLTAAMQLIYCWKWRYNTINQNQLQSHFTEYEFFFKQFQILLHNHCSFRLEYFNKRFVRRTPPTSVNHRVLSSIVPCMPSLFVRRTPPTSVNHRVLSSIVQCIPSSFVRRTPTSVNHIVLSSIVPCMPSSFVRRTPPTSVNYRVLSVVHSSMYTVMAAIVW
jgi:hypothetical protein